MAARLAKTSGPVSSDVSVLTSYKSISGNVYTDKNSAVLDNTYYLAKESLLKFLHEELAMPLADADKFIVVLTGHIAPDNDLSKAKELLARLTAIIGYYDNESNIKPGVKA